MLVGSINSPLLLCLCREGRETGKFRRTGRLIALAFDFWSERDLRGVNLGKVGPTHVFVIKAARERGLDDHEVRRNVEIAWRIKRRVTDLGDFAPPCLALDALDLGQDRITHGVESLRNQRRTDDAAGIAGTERDRSA